MPQKESRLNPFQYIYIYKHISLYYKIKFGEIMKTYKIMRMDEAGKYYYEEYGTLNEARAAMLRLSKDGIMDGGVIFKPTGFGFIIPGAIEGSYLYSGPRSDFRGINEDGTLMSIEESWVVRGF